MNTRGLVITAWLVVGHAILGLLYWLLLQIPESNVFMLAGSVAVVIVMVLWAGAVEATALAAWAPGIPLVQAGGAGLRRAIWIVPPALVFLLLWYATGHVSAWLDAHSSEAAAWFIATRGWTDVSWLHTTLGWIVWFLRYGCGVSLAAALMAGLVTKGAGTLAGAAWLKRAFHWRTLLLTTAVLFVCVWLPWRYVVNWRPESLPLSWVQPAFAAVKLGVVFVVMNAAWAYILRRAARP